MFTVDQTHDNSLKIDSEGSFLIFENLWFFVGSEYPTDFLSIISRNTLGTASNCMPEVATELILTLRIICRLGATRLGPRLALGVWVKVSVKVGGYG